jgi:uncharacterized damage-inducible protein DinB
VTRSAHLAVTLSDILAGDPWYAPALMSVLAGITPSAAAARPLGAQSHSIGQIAGHIEAWNRVCWRRLAGEAVAEPPVNFPSPSALTAGEWDEARRGLEASCRELIAYATAATAADLARSIPGKNYTTEFLLEGAGQHWIYHAGQIAMLRSGVDPKAE